MKRSQTIRGSWLLALNMLAISGHAQGLLHSDKAFPGPIRAIEDVDGDGARDLVVSSPTTGFSVFPLRDEIGVVEVRSGRSGRTIRRWTSSHAFDGFGRGLGVLGDLDGDGLDDVAIGSPQRAGGGVVEVFSTGSGARIQVFGGDDNGESVGWSIFALGDIDQRGSCDYLVGACGRYFDFSPLLRHAHVVAGEDGTCIRSHKVVWDWTPMHGDLMSGLGDMNGDGIDDYAIADVESPGIGPFVRVHSGLDGSEILVILDLGVSVIGFTMTGLSDMNSDGVPEWAISAPHCCNDDQPNQGSSTGSIFVFDGRTGQRKFVRHHSHPEISFGYDMDRIPDQDGDGFDDLLVISIGSLAPIAFAPGLIHVISGRTGADLTAPIRGYRVRDAEYLGDLNGDGHGDFGIRDPFTSYSDSLPEGGFGIVLGGTRPNRPIGCGPTGTLPCSAELFPSAGGSLLLSPKIEVQGLRFRSRTTGFLFWGTQWAADPFNDAQLCVRPPYQVLRPQFSGGSPDGNDCTGSFFFEFELTTLIASGIGPGEPFYAQVWSTDPGGPTGSQLSGSVELRYWR